MSLATKTAKRILGASLAAGAIMALAALCFWESRQINLNGYVLFARHGAAFYVGLSSGAPGEGPLRGGPISSDRPDPGAFPLTAGR